ncbi:MAG: hypothetical protein ACJAUJ_001242 [Salibacteraceae bacterium]
MQLTDINADIKLLVSQNEGVEQNLLAKLDEVTIHFDEQLKENHERLNLKLTVLKEGQSNIERKVVEGNASLSSQFNDIYLDFKSVQNSSTKEIGSLINQSKENSQTQHDILVERLSSAENENKSTFNDLSEKLNYSFNSISNLNKESEEVLKSQLEKLIEKHSTSYSNIEKLNIQVEENLIAQLSQLLENQTTSFNSIENSNKESEESIKNQLEETLKKHAASFDAIEETSKLAEKNILSQISSLLEDQITSFNSIKSSNKGSDESIKNQLEEILIKHAASFEVIEENNKHIESNILTQLTKLLEDQIVSFNSIETSGRGSEESIKNQLEEIHQKHIASFDVIEESNKQTESNVLLQLSQLLENQTTSFGQIQNSNKESEKGVTSKLEAILKKHAASFDVLEETNKDVESNILKQLSQVLDVQATSFDSIKNLNTELEQSVSIQLQNLLKKYTLTYLTISKFNDQTEKSIQSQKEFLLKNEATYLDINKNFTKQLEDISQNQNSALNKLDNQISLNEKQSALTESLGIEYNKLFKLSSELAENVNLLPQEIEKVNESKKQFLKIHIEKQLNFTYDRIDALHSIHKLIKINAPLPIMHEWRITSDFAHKLLNSLINKNGSVIDIGSGVSSLIMAYAMKNKGSGTVIALESNLKYFEQSVRLVNEHQLNDWCTVYYCPLKEYNINNKKWLWYDISKVKIPENISLICVDGPPADTQPLARYPALPLLKEHLNENTSVFLDDGNREDERMIAEAWSKEFNLNSYRNKYLKGYFELSKEKV